MEVEEKPKKKAPIKVKGAKAKVDIADLMKKAIKHNSKSVNSEPKEEEKPKPKPKKIIKKKKQPVK